MAKLLSLRPIGKSARFRARFDDDTELVVDLDLRQRFGLHSAEPCELRQTTLEELRRESARIVAWDRAQAMLAVKSRSSVDLRRRLVGKGIAADDADNALERLSRTGLVDDARHARHFTRSRLQSGLGARRIAQELSRQGVATQLQGEVLSEALADDTIDAAASLERIAARRWNGLSRLAPDVRRRRFTAFLARRGHSHDTIRRLIARLEAADREAR